MQFTLELWYSGTPALTILHYFREKECKCWSVNVWEVNREFIEMNNAEQYNFTFIHVTHLIGRPPVCLCLMIYLKYWSLVLWLERAQADKRLHQTFDLDLRSFSYKIFTLLSIRFIWFVLFCFCFPFEKLTVIFSVIQYFITKYLLKMPWGLFLHLK